MYLVNVFTSAWAIIFLALHIEHLTFTAKTFVIWRHALAAVSCCRIHTSATIETWLPHTVIHDVLTIGTRITNWALASVGLYIIHTGTSILARFGCTVVDIELADHASVSCLTYASEGIQATDAYTVILARVWSALVIVQFAEISTVPLSTLTSKCSSFIYTGCSIDTRRALCAEAVRKFTLISSIFIGAQAFESIHL